MLGNPTVRVTGAENVRQILQGEHVNVISVWPYTFRTILGGKSISNMSGNEHAYFRKMVMKGFTHAALNSYISYTKKIINIKVGLWNNLDEPVDIHNNILEMTFEVSVKVMTGLQWKNQEEMQKTCHIFQEMIRNIFCFPYNLPFSGFRKAQNSRNYIHAILDHHLRKKVERINANGNEESIEETPAENDVIQRILEADMMEKIKSNGSEEESENGYKRHKKCGFSIDELKQNAVELMFAGFKTTASGISSLIIQLTKYPDVRKRIEGELKENGLLAEGSVVTSLEQIQKLTYLEQVVKETLRIMPPITGGFRKARKTFRIGNYRIPKAWTVIYDIRGTHKNEFENSDVFDPDRFSRENWTKNKDNRFRWIPFGGGPRICPGNHFAKLVIKLTVIEMIAHFKDWKFSGDEEPSMSAIPILQPRNGLCMRLKSRRAHNHG
uniref:cytochrome P450 26B1-like n=1 Tax=Styela clava TaxID=7725 RepID=UPI001939F89B|nr:cytochrome P450 26B1-like [Styela clava]